MNKGERDILIAITQLSPRILEQSILLDKRFVLDLNGDYRLVKFTYSN